MEQQVIKPRKIRLPRYRVYDPHGNCIGTVNDLEFMDFRAQIRESNADGYTLEYEGERLEINRHGRLPVWPHGLFSKIDDLLNRLL